MAKLSSIIGTVTVLALLSGCGSGSNGTARTATSTHRTRQPWYISGGPSPPAVTRHIVLARLPRLGIVLVDGKGHPLYAFVPDTPDTTCAGSCAGAWPAFTLTPEHVLDSSPGLSEELLSIVPKEYLPERTRLVSYAGWLLHSYAGDTSADKANGQGLHIYGGHWYVLAASGKLVKAGA